MITTPTYYAVFFEAGKLIGHKRIALNVWQNLTDRIEGKTVAIEGAMYEVGEIKVFNIINSIDNNVFAVVDVKFMGKSYRTG